MAPHAHDSTRKPMLTVGQQVEHLKAKGVTFNLCSEAEASSILSTQDHFYRLAACRTLFPKRVGGGRNGQYATLDFGHLVDLTELDTKLREFLLPLALSIESSARTKLVEHIAERPDEDGYSILSDYFASMGSQDRQRRYAEIERLSNDAYLGDLVARYPVEDMPSWVFLELSSFGAFTSFYRFCASRWSDSGLMDEHYLLRRVNSLRNAAAHSSAIINGLGKTPDSPTRYPAAVATALNRLGISKRLRQSKMRNPRVLQMTILAYTYTRLVPREKQAGSAEKLSALELRMRKNSTWYQGNNTICSAYEYLSRIFDGFIKQDGLV